MSKRVKKPIKTMTAGEAFNLAITKNKLTLNDHYFTVIGWKSPSSGMESGPYLVTKIGLHLIEVTHDLEFKGSIALESEHYFRWIKPMRGT